MNKKKKLLILYDWFYPGFKAGGPIQSLTNLAAALIPDFEIYVITRAFDLNSNEPYANVTANTWNTVFLPGSSVPIQVFYVCKKSLDRTTFHHLFTAVGAVTVYLNGIFSYRFFLLPLLYLKTKAKDVKVIVCPRGMLKKGALSGKALKKKIYINFLKFSGLLNNIWWHATTPEEAEDIVIHFPANKNIIVASNIPKSPYSNVSRIEKRKGEIRLVFLSLINTHKNLLLLLNIVNQTDAAISLDIYGPVVDEALWSRCESLIKQMPAKVQYKGEVEPAKVQQVLSEYHVLVLFTKGENFGHAIYESLSVGRPVITSHFTPWQNLFNKQAGINVNIEDDNDCFKNIILFSLMEQDQYDSFCTGAHTMAINFYNNLNIRDKYLQLFQ